MPRKPRIIIFASESFTLATLLVRAISKEVGLEVVSHIIDSYNMIEEDLPGEIEGSEIECVVFSTEGTTTEKATEIYCFWKKYFPNTPFIWCHSNGALYEDHNQKNVWAPWASNENWTGITWIDTEANTDGKAPYDLLIKTLNKILE